MSSLAAPLIKISVLDLLVKEPAVRLSRNERIIDVGANSKIGIPSAVSEAHEHGQSARIVVDLVNRF